MTPTEISEHAKEAANWRVYEKMDGRHCTDLDAIQHGINLAVAEKDKEIRRLSVLLLESQPLNVRLDEQVRSKDKRIAELEASLSSEKSAIDEFTQWLEAYKYQVIGLEGNLQSKDREIERLTTERDMWKATANTSAAHKSAQLTEANAKLAEAEEKILDETRLKEIWIVKASNTADQLSSAKSEIERLKEELRREINIRP